MALSDSIPSKQDLTDQARHLAEEQKGRGAQRLEGVARAVHSAASEFERDLPQAAGYIHEAASQIERASAAVREKSIEDIVAAIDDFARRQPVAFFGGSVLAGFVLSRFLKSSAAAGTGSGRAAAPAPRAQESGPGFPPDDDRIAAGGA